MNFSKFHIELNADLAWRFFLFLAATAAILSASESAFATTNPTDTLGESLCRIALSLSGNIARGIATVAIFTIGVSLFMGKMNWGMALAIAAGIAIVFGAPKIVAWLSGNTNNECIT